MKGLQILVLLGTVLFGLPPSQAAVAPRETTEYLRWRTALNQVDAQIEAWPLERLLQQITTQSGWQVYVEPGAERVVSAKFKHLEIREALARLLGSLNYALLPQPLGVAKLFVFHTSVQGATHLVPPLPDDKASAANPHQIPNELIVKLKPGAKVDIDQLAKLLGATVVGRNDKLNAYRLRFTEETAANKARESLTTNADVDSVDSNYYVEQPTRVQTAQMLGTPRLNLKAKAATDGALVIGLIDTAVQAQEPSIKNFLLDGIAVAGQAETPADSPTHGTAMAATILQGMAAMTQPSDGVATRILPVDVYGSNENTTTFDVANGIYQAVENGATLINLSLGGYGQSDFLHDVITEASNQGVHFVAAAGNEPTTQSIYPAAFSEVMAVTAADQQGNIATYANRGDYVDVGAPDGNYVEYNNQSYLYNGTSVSAAYVSGLAAGLTTSANKTLAEADQEIRNTLPVKQP